MNTTDKRPSGPPPHRTADTALTPERWQQIKEVFADAQERNPSERAAFLNDVCAADESLRSEVESLLAAAQREAGGDQDSPARVGQRRTATPLSQRAPDSGQARSPEYRQVARWWQHGRGSPLSGDGLCAGCAD